MGSPTPPLRKQHRNDVIKAMEAVGLDPVEFDFGRHGAGTRVKHRWSESYFNFDRESTLYAGDYVVGDGPTWPYRASSWSVLMRTVKTWLDDVKRDIETPDLWAELQSAAELVAAGPGEPAENTPFTREEQEEIARRLREVAENAKSMYSLSEAQMGALNEKLDYLVDAAGRLDRTDWRGVLIGTALSFVLGAALPPDPARHIFFLILRVIVQRYGFPEVGGG